MTDKILSVDQVLAAEDVEYVTVPTPEWGGHVRLGTVCAEAILTFVERRDSVIRKLRLLVRSIIDKDGQRVAPHDIERHAKALKKKHGDVVHRLFEAVLELNHLADDPAILKNVYGGAVIAASPIG